MNDTPKCPFNHEGLDPSKQDLASLPARMQGLPRDKRGYVVPWFVDKDPATGEFEFRALDPAKWHRAIKESLCWVCGVRLGRFKTFVIGPMCGINRTTSEPPCHLECAHWSVKNCPFMNNPEFVRRTDGNINALSKPVGGIAIGRNPGVSLLWTTKDFVVWRDGSGGILITVGEPTEVEFWREGRKATRKEVLASIESGLPYLEVQARRQAGATEALGDMIVKFSKFLPAAEV